MKRGRKSKYFSKETFENRWNVALYIRLSVQDGDKEESNSIVNQKELLNMFLEKEKELTFYNYYIDDGFTGTTFERPAFKKMMEDVELGLVNTIIVKDISRLGRNFIEMGNLVQNIFLVKNIRFISVCDNLDSFANPKSIENIFFPLKNLLNEMYCKDISNKITKAFNIMKKEGKFIGSYPPFGYLKENGNKHHLIIDNASATVVKMIFDLCESGIGNTLIAKELNERCILTPSEYRCKILNLKSTGKKVSNQWTPSIVGKILDNRVYSGDLVQSKYKNISYKVHKQIKNKEEDYIIVENTHEPIIDKERFLKIQELRKDRKYNWNKRVEDNSIFKDLVICSNCEKPMKLIITNKKEISEIKIKKYAFKCNNCNIENKKDFYIKVDTLKTCIFRSIKYHIDLLRGVEEARKEIKPRTEYTKSTKQKVENMQCELEKVEKDKVENYEKWKNTARQFMNDIRHGKKTYEEFDKWLDKNK